MSGLVVGLRGYLAACHHEAADPIGSGGDHDLGSGAANPERRGLIQWRRETYNRSRGLIPWKSDHRQAL